MTTWKPPAQIDEMMRLTYRPLVKVVIITRDRNLEIQIGLQGYYFWFTLLT